MTPKEKANELANKMFNGSVFDYRGKEELKKEQERAKRCALIAVNEILKSNPCCESLDRGANFIWQDNTYYWQEVRKEIEAL